MRAVVDTNILVRALIKPRGTVGPVLSRLRDGAYVYLFSTEILEELVLVLARPRLVEKHGLERGAAEALVDLLVLRGEEVHPTRRINACRDPKDDKFLEVALEGRADVIVSGDQDLLVLSPFEQIPVLEPAAFLRSLQDR